MLAFYADRSPIFMAARFNAKRAAPRAREGEGTPVHVVIPTPNPWVPLRILALGRKPRDLIQADVFLLTDREPETLPQAVAPTGNREPTGLDPGAQRAGVASLMNDLRSDSRIEVDPERHVAHVPADRRAGRRRSRTTSRSMRAGSGMPDPIAAGFRAGVGRRCPMRHAARSLLWLGAGLALVALFARRRIQQAATTR